MNTETPSPKCEVFKDFQVIKVTIPYSDSQPPVVRYHIGRAVDTEEVRFESHYPPYRSYPNVDYVRDIRHAGPRQRSTIQVMTLAEVAADREARKAVQRVLRLCKNRMARRIIVRDRIIRELEGLEAYSKSVLPLAVKCNKKFSKAKTNEQKKVADAVQAKQ